MKSFEEEYRQNIRAVFAFLMAVTGDYNLSEELTQETFFRAYRSMNSFRGDCKISVWLCQIAKHCLYDHRKKEKRRSNAVCVDDSSMFPSVSAIFECGETVRELLVAVTALPDPYKSVLMLHAFAEMPLKEIAGVFEKTESWARVTCFRAREKLREALKGGSG